MKGINRVNIANKIYLFSTSLHSLYEEKLSTSSSKFELNFAIDLSTKFDEVVILSPKINLKEQRDNILLCPVNQKNKFLINYIGYFKNKEKSGTIIFWGYNPLTLIQCIYLKNKMKIFTFIYDTHLAALKKRKKIKNILISSFYKLGVKLINFLDGVILFKEEASIELNLKIPFIVTTAVSRNQKKITQVHKNNDLFKVVYAGTLIEYNCSKNIVEAAKILKNIDRKIKFEIYGDGELYLSLKNECINLDNIHFYGRVDSLIVENAILNADLLLNIRDTDSIVNKFSFPSKLVEYLESQNAILSTNLNYNKDFESVVFILDNTSPLEIANKILYIKENHNEVEQKTNMISDYLKINHNKEKELEKIIKFISLIE